MKGMVLDDLGLTSMTYTSGLAGCLGKGESTLRRGQGQYALLSFLRGAAHSALNGALNAARGRAGGGVLLFPR